MDWVLKLFGLSPQWTLASIGARILTAVLAIGGTYWGVSTAYENWKNNLCAVKVDNVTSAIKDQTVATLQAKLNDQSNLIKNLEARRADDELAIKMASEQAKNLQSKLRDLQAGSPQYLTDAEVDLLNGKLLSKRK